MKSIRSKLWVGMMVLVALVLLLLWFSQIVFLERFYLHIRVSEIKDRAYRTATKLIDGQSINMEDKLDALASDENINLEFLDPDGALIYSTGMTGSMRGGHMGMMKGNAWKQILRRVLSGEEIVTAMTHMRLNSQFILMGLPIKSDVGIIGAMLINMPIAPIDATVAILKRQLILITIVLVVVSVIISSFISKTLSKPIRDITNAAEGMARGDFDIRIKTKSRDEIGVLANTFNHMGSELTRIDELRKELIANVSHDFRTPLSLIRGYAETIRDVTGESPEKRERQLGIIIDESQRLGSMVDDILNLSQMQAGYIILSMEEFDIHDTVEGIRKRFEILCREHHIELDNKVHGSHLVMGDEFRIEQVLYNLISNAFAHTPSGGKVTISGSDLGERIRIEISDSGSGISEKELKDIWNRYYKGDRKGGRTLKGHGLGLAIVKSILDAHKLPFGVKSREGEGTTFWFEMEKSF